MADNPADRRSSTPGPEGPGVDCVCAAGRGMPARGPVSRKRSRSAAPGSTIHPGYLSARVTLGRALDRAGRARRRADRARLVLAARPKISPPSAASPKSIIGAARSPRRSRSTAPRWRSPATIPICSGPSPISSAWSNRRSRRLDDGLSFERWRSRVSQESAAATAGPRRPRAAGSQRADPAAAPPAEFNLASTRDPAGRRRLGAHW